MQNDDPQDPKIISLDDLAQEEKDEEKKHEDFRSPAEEGEESVSGSAPDPESDDDTLKNVQALDIQAGESTEHPEELDLARDIDKSEQNTQE